MKRKSEITEEIYKDLLERNNRGLTKYGHLLDDNNSDDMIQHAYEEALDMCQYLKKEILNKKTIQKLIKLHPNDAELGKVVRDLYS